MAEFKVKLLVIGIVSIITSLMMYQLHISIPDTAWLSKTFTFLVYVEFGALPVFLLLGYILYRL